MNLQEAYALAKNYIANNLRPPDGDKYEIVDSGIRETDAGWYFPWQTARYIETRNIEYSIVGNWPIFVTKDGDCRGPCRPVPTETLI